jgi:transposase-like protein
MSTAALTNYRKARAVELALSGASYDQIAAELGLANRGTAWRCVDRALRERRFHAVDAYREAELKRLQRIEDQLWPRLHAGDIRAAEGIRAVINQRVRLLGLLTEATKESNECTCDCPVHGSHGSWRPTLRPEDALLVEKPSVALVAEVEERMEAWAGEIGIGWLFYVMTVVAQVMELVKAAEATGGSAA